MTVRPSIIFLCSILIAAMPSLGQHQPTQQSHLPEPQTDSSNSNSDLKRELLRIQMELSQIAQDMDAIDARMIQRIANNTSDGTSKAIPAVYEQLKEHSADKGIKVYFDSPRNDIRWELCLKAGKLYTGLFDKVLQMSRARLSGDGKAQTPFSVADESPEAVQLVFLARVMAELEFRYSELRFQFITNPDAKQQDLWRRLRVALQNDDRTYLEKLNALLAKAGMSPGSFAAKVVSDAQKTSHTAANAVVEGMGIVNPSGDTWRLADIPGINPDFIQALECDNRAIKSFLEAGSNAAIVQACSCRKYADGSYILALVEKRAGPAEATNLEGKTPSNVGGPNQDTGVFRLPKDDLTQELQNFKKGSTIAGTDQRPRESKDVTYGSIYKAAAKPNIPSWWIRCECPEDHPDAGMVVDGVRWHAPVLRCPDPEVKRWQVK